MYAMRVSEQRKESLMRLVAARTRILTLLLIGALPAASLAAKKPAESSAPAGVELQHMLMDFADRLTFETLTAFDQFEDHLETADQRAVAEERQLFNAVAALTIATERDPDLALLDMIVLVTLERIGTEKYWLPEFFGEAGIPYLEAVRALEGSIRSLGREVMTEAQIHELNAIIEDWEDNPPDFFRRASFFRLSDLSEGRLRQAGQGPDQSGGLFASVRSAATAADEAKELGERVMFLVQRLPILLGAQVEYQVRELGQMPLVTDALADLERIPPGIERVATSMDQLVPVFEQVGQLLPSEAGDAATAIDAADQRLRGLAEEVERMLEVGGELVAALQETVQAADGLVNRVSPLERMNVENVQAALADANAAAAHLERSVASIERILASEDLAQASPLIESTVDRVGGVGESLIDRAYAGGIKLILIFFVGLLITLLAYRYLASKIERSA
jgi:hypothetical protein